LSEELVLLLFY